MVFVITVTIILDSIIVVAVMSGDSCIAVIIPLYLLLKLLRRKKLKNLTRENLAIE